MITRFTPLAIEHARLLLSAIEETSDPLSLKAEAGARWDQIEYLALVVTAPSLAWIAPFMTASEATMALKARQRELNYIEWILPEQTREHQSIRTSVEQHLERVTMELDNEIAKIADRSKAALGRPHRLRPEEEVAIAIWALRLKSDGQSIRQIARLMWSEGVLGEHNNQDSTAAETHLTRILKRYKEDKTKID